MVAGGLSGSTSARRVRGSGPAGAAATDGSGGGAVGAGVAAGGGRGVDVIFVDGEDGPVSPVSAGAGAAGGGAGWPEQAPFDRIIVTAAAPARPDALLQQLGPGGVLVAPVGAGATQELLRYRLRDDGVFEEEVLMEVRFVPMLPGVPREG